ncbi:MAG TPA: FAD-dependent oxidoreductase [Gemmatimonadales bacterium]|nr:FAD-dependent oxidoreductase [Gemmatimonadales bacterium]
MAKPVIMSVDDDPEVLGAVERDLRRHFRSDYRILAVSSGPQALETTQQLKARDAAVALFLVDERMPQMSGTQFLTEARRLYPDARKVLLTAYADTEAAITGINAVGLDHYLMKPWDPPEQHLYPVLDELLADWSAAFRAPFEGIRVAGSRWSPRSYEIKDFLSRNQTAYRWIDLDMDQATRALVETITPGLKALPVVFFPDGSALAAPTSRELAERIGLQTQARQPFYDLIVVGGGPSGLAAAVYGASEGLRTILLELGATGGQAGTSSQIENYLGFPSGIAGADLARRATIQARRFGAEVVTPRGVAAIRVEDPYRIVVLDDGSELRCYALLLATGMIVRRLDVPGADALTGAGVYYGAAVAEASAHRGADVVVVGGANSAGQAALLFARYARKVTMLVRGASLQASMSTYLLDRIAAAENIEVRTHTSVVAVCGTDRLESVDLQHADTGERSTLPATAMFVFIGSAPLSDMVAGLVERDDLGFVITGPDLLRNGKRPKGWTLDRDPFLLETSVPGIFASGDVRLGSTKRVASAVGEGSAAVGMIHKYLETV